MRRLIEIIPWRLPGRQWLLVFNLIGRRCPLINSFWGGIGVNIIQKVHPINFFSCTLFFLIVSLQRLFGMVLVRSRCSASDIPRFSIFGWERKSNRHKQQIQGFFPIDLVLMAHQIGEQVLHVFSINIVLTVFSNKLMESVQYPLT